MYSPGSGTYEVASDIPLEYSLGAVIDIQFNFYETIDSESPYVFIPILHTPLQEAAVFTDSEISVVVAYDHASPSLQGEYVLCGDELDSEVLQCGERVAITIHASKSIKK